MNSAIYHGWLRHRRYAPRSHSFRYPLFMVYLDLAELDSVFAGRWLWSAGSSKSYKWPALARFDRTDHLGDPAIPLDAAVRDLVEERNGRRPDGPIRLLTHLRYFGYCFNPVSFYYCFDAVGTRVETIVAEVHNTPWGERHCYVLDSPESAGRNRLLRYRTEKAMHVSPFMPMSLTYRWGLSVPGERLAVHMSLHDEWKVFDATMSLVRRPMSAPALAKTLVAYPFMTGKVIAAIHWQALKLWLKGVPVHPHVDPEARRERGAIQTDGGARAAKHA